MCLKPHLNLTLVIFEFRLKMGKTLLPLSAQQSACSFPSFSFFSRRSPARPFPFPGLPLFLHAPGLALLPAVPQAQPPLALALGLPRSPSSPAMACLATNFVAQQPAARRAPLSSPFLLIAQPHPSVVFNLATQPRRTPKP